MIVTRNYSKLQLNRTKIKMSVLLLVQVYALFVKAKISYAAAEISNHNCVNICSRII